ncbi:MAG: titin [Spirosomataceae bacterium]|jgi:titin
MAFTTYEYSLQVGDVPAIAGPTVWTPNPAASSAGPNYAIILTPQTVPSAPTNLFIDLAKTTTMSHNITWDDNATNEDGYEIAHSSDGFNFTTIRQVSPNLNDFFLGGLYPDRNVIIKVRSYNVTPAGVEQFSPYSNVVAAKTLRNPPAAPTALTEVQTCVNETSFYWSHPNVGTVDEFWVEQSPDGVNYRIHDKFAVGSYTLGSAYKVQSLPAGKDQFFRIRAVNNVNSLNSSLRAMGPTSTVLNVKAKTPTGPPPPTNLRVIIKTDSVVTFAWNQPYGFDFICNTNVRTATHLRFRINDGPLQERILDANATTINLRDLPQGAKVEFGVYGVNGFYGLESETIYITTTLLGPPAAPTKFFTSSNIDVYKTPNISMTWTDNSNNEDKFVVEATIDTLAGISFAVSLAPDVNYYTHIPVDEGVTWYYRSYSMNSFGRSANSNWSFGRVEYSQLPEKPYNLRGSLSNGKIFLNWKDDTLREENFEVERSEDDGTTFAKVGTALRNMLTFNDSTMERGKTYKYRVRAVNTLGGSGYSNMVTFTMPAVIAATSSVEDLISVFPNPAVNRVRVNVPEFISEEGGFVSVYDQGQKLVYKGKISVGNNEHNFDMQNLREGMYVIVITTDTQKISKKIYKK